MAPYVTWQDYYSVGDEALDAQHRQILDIINELYKAMRKEVDGDVVKPLLDRLVQYTMNHFQREEETMLAHQYPDFALHKALHDKMRRETAAWRDNFTIVTGHDLLFFLKQWWSNHIQVQDQGYAPYLTVAADA